IMARQFPTTSWIGLLALCAFVSVSPERSNAQDTTFSAKAHYTKRDAMIPMRDGTKLYTIIYAPKDSTRNFPILLLRTPYSIRPYEPDSFRTPLGPSLEFDREGYIFVYQDVRGKFRSEGEFEVLRPLETNRRTVDDTDESTDAYDTIDWLVRNVRRNNGRVGMWGISYSAWQTVMGMMGPHQALRAASPQASPADMFIGDDFHHNGAFRLMYAFSWLAGNARTRAGQGTTAGERFDYGTPDGYRFFMEAGAPSRIDSLYFHGQVPAWNDFMKHPNYDDYWKAQNVLKDLNRVPPTLAVLHVAGWFDAEDFYGPMSIYYGLEKVQQRNMSSLVVGPWLHGGWYAMTGEELGNIKFGSPTSKHFQTEVQFPFFQCHLKERCTRTMPEATVFETGSNRWRTYDTWPPKNATERKIYLHANGKLSFDAPRTPGFDEYVHDPSRPVPFSAETRTTQGHLWMIEDQRFAATRPDVLVYESDPLEEDVTIAGPIMANLFASTSGTDADWVVKLIDVLPGNTPDNDPNPRGVRMGHFQMLLAGEVMRAKYRSSYEQPTAVVPNEVTPYSFDLRDRYHTFKKGHRIMVQVQSSWFPVIDRNPGVFTNIYQAKPSDYRRTTQRVHRSPSQASHLAVRVLQQATTSAQ
ncbi:MAG TPA: CocE/NonD family hydrolase, partial [Gemmatimonadaceae bacterium]|nr:CocE/NonD family hydrolase [Gemmatimonadaceae bacterium]